MQNETTPAEGKDSAQTESESALRGAACSPLLRYKWRVGGTIDIYDSGDIYPSQDGEWVRWKDVQDMIEALKKWEDGAAEILPPGADPSESGVAGMFFESFEELKEELSAARLEAEDFRDNMRIHLTESDGKFSWENSQDQGAQLP